MNYSLRFFLLFSFYLFFNLFSVIAQNNTLVSSQEQEILTLINKKEFNQASLLCNKLIESDKMKTPEWYYYLGVTFDSLKSYGSAMNAYNKAIYCIKNKFQVVPFKYKDVYINLTNDLIQFEKYDEALLSYSEATKIDINQDGSYYYFISALSSFQKKDMVNYFSDIATAISMNKKNIKYFEHRAFVNCQTKQYLKAIEDYSEAILLEPQTYANYQGRAMAYKELKKYLEAQNDFNKVIALNPDNEIAKNKIKELYELGYEKDSPEIIILFPKLNDGNILYIPFSKKQITINGYIKDKSLIKTILINNLSASFSGEEINPKFSVLLNFDSTEYINFTSTDIYNNSTSIKYKINDDRPKAIIEAPQTNTSHEILIGKSVTFVELFGRLTGNYKSLFIEEQQVPFENDGIFHKTVKIPTEFIIHFSVVDIYDSTYTSSYKFIQNEGNASVVVQNKPPETILKGSGDPLKGLNVSKSKEEIVNGQYYALIIGIDKYSGQWQVLKNATHDAKALEILLNEKYKLDYIYSLYDEQATRTNILNSLEKLVNTIKETDNLLIYFSGHGEFKQSLNKGYWVPFDAKTNNVSDMISNNDIQTFLASIKSKHTLLISDACFSGDIFRGNTISVPFEESEKYYIKVYGKNSRQAITSGGLEPVMDGGKDGHSVFAYYLLKTLTNNQSKYFDAGQLFDNLKIPVVNNSDQTPLLNPLKNTGDEGGQFLFINKK